MDNGAILPVLLPLGGALITLFWTQPSFGRRTFVTALLTALLAWEGYLIHATSQGTLFTTHVGNWLPPFGIAMVVDLLSALFLFFCTFLLFSSLLYAFAVDPPYKEHPLRIPLLLLLFFGVNLTLVTGDFFNLFVAFEVMLLSSYALMTLEGEVDAMEYAFPYIAMNVIGSLLFFTTAGITYGYFGTLNFAHLAQLAADPAHHFPIELIALLSIGIFGLKSAIFPLYFWLPNSYPILPTSIAAIFAGVLTKVGVYVLIRLFATVFPPELTLPNTVLLTLSGLTMFLGVLGAVAQGTIKRILSYHIISQIGFMILAIGMGSVPAIAAAIVYTLHNVIVKGSLFLLGGSGALLYGTDELKKMGHLWGLLPFIGTLFFMQALSLAGIPPFSGFWAKYLVLFEGLRTHHYFLVAIAVITGWLTLFSMIKIWSYAFWGPEQEPEQEKLSHPWTVRAALALPVAFSLIIAFGAQGFIVLAEKASRQATDRSHYAGEAQ